MWCFLFYQSHIKKLIKGKFIMSILFYNSYIQAPTPTRPAKTPKTARTGNNRGVRLFKAFAILAQLTTVQPASKACIPCGPSSSTQVMQLRPTEHFELYTSTCSLTSSTKLPGNITTCVEQDAIDEIAKKIVASNAKNIFFVNRDSLIFFINSI